jgi:hypothetical protein
MLAALLLNLPDYQAKPDGMDADAGRKARTYARSVRSNSRQVLLEAADEIERLLDGKTPPVPVKRLTKRVKRYAEDKGSASDLSQMIADLQMRIFELRRTEVTWVFPVVTEMEVMLELLMQDEEDILILLLAE